MKNKENILEAIDHYDKYNKSTKAILKTLIAMSDDNNVANISITTLAKLSQVSRQGVYNALRYVERDKLVLRLKESGDRTIFFNINREELDSIVKYYETLKLAEKIL